MNKKSIAGILAVSLLLGACAKVPSMNPDHPTIDSDIALLNKRISHSLDAAMIEACGRGTHYLNKNYDAPPSEIQIEEIHTAIEAIDHTLDCRIHNAADFVKKREAVVETVRLTLPDIFFAAKSEGKEESILPLPNLTEELRQASATTLRLQDELLRLRTEI
jgi:hypothetical protein